jgi:hypothetical protein
VKSLLRATVSEKSHAVMTETGEVRDRTDPETEGRGPAKEIGRVMTGGKRRIGGVPEIGMRRLKGAKTRE